MGPKRKSTNQKQDFSDGEFDMNSETQNTSSKFGGKNTEKPIDEQATGDKWEPSYTEDEALEYLNNEINYGLKNQEDDPCYERKQKLLEDCLNMLQNDDLFGCNTLNIAVIGPPGCGKSSFLNTVFASLNSHCWTEFAKCGEFGNYEGVMGMQVSVRLKSFQKEHYYQGKDFRPLPTFIDMTGFENDSSVVSEELLQLVFRGKVQENEMLLDIKKYGQENGVISMRKKYRSRLSHRRINRIIIVCSANPDSALPSVLLRTVVKVAKELDITCFGVMTHTDKYKAKTNSKVKEREEMFIKMLGLPRSRFAKVINYCPDVDPEGTYEDSVIPSIDAPVLRLVRQVLTPEPNDRVLYAENYIKAFVSVAKFLMCFGIIAFLIVGVTELFVKK